MNNLELKNVKGSSDYGNENEIIRKVFWDGTVKKGIQKEIEIEKIGGIKFESN